MAVVIPYFLNMFWQIPDGLEILKGHLPSTVGYAIASGPLISQEWLYEAAMAWFALHGAYGTFVVICAFAAAVTPLLVYALVRAFGIGEVSAGIAALLVVGSRFVGSATRPETFAVDAFAVELLVLAGSLRWWWILPCVAIWANVHASVILAPIAACAFAAAQAVARRGVDPTVRRSFAIAGAATLGTLLTPFGLRLWQYAFALAVAPNPVRENLDTWRALSFDTPGSLLAVAPGMLVLLCYGLVMRRRNLPETIVGGICFVLTVMHARYAMFLAIGWAPAIARTLDERTPLGALSARRPVAPVLALAPLVLYAAIQGFQTIRIPIERPGPWQAAAAMATEHGLHGNAYAPYVWAAFLHWRGLPLRLLIDAHGDPYPRDVWNDHLALEGVHSNWRAVLRRRHLSVVIVPLDTPLAQVLLLEPGWERVDVRDGIVAFHKVDRPKTALGRRAAR